MAKHRGRRKTVVKREKILTGEHDDKGRPEFDWGSPILEPVFKNDVKVRITADYRVYRDVDHPENWGDPVDPAAALPAAPVALAAAPAKSLPPIRVNEDEPDKPAHPGQVKIKGK